MIVLKLFAISLYIILKLCQFSNIDLSFWQNHVVVGNKKQAYILSWMCMILKNAAQYTSTLLIYY
jgi:hypothetical protein